MSIILILLALCGTVLIFFSAHSVFITAERSVMKHHIQLFQKRLSYSIVGDTGTERNFGYSHNE